MFILRVLKTFLSRRLIAGVLAIVYLSTNVLFVHAQEMSVWSERRHSLSGHSASTPYELASLPSELPRLDATGFTPAATLPFSARSEKIPATLSAVLAVISPLHGTMRAVHLASSTSSAPVLIHIQDVHANQEAQNNIDRMIDALCTGGHLDLVALEGAFAPLRLEPFRRFPDAAIRKEVADFLESKNWLSGPVHAALLHAGAIPAFVGIDDAREYEANAQAWRRSRDDEKPARERWTRWSNELEMEKRKRFNPDLYTFDAWTRGYADGHLALGDYAEGLSRRVLPVPPTLAAFVKAMQAERALDLPRIEVERSSLVMQLSARAAPETLARLASAAAAFRGGRMSHAAFYTELKETADGAGLSMKRFPAMKNYLRYLALSEQIDGEQLFSEMDQARENILGRLVRNEEEKNLLTRSALASLVSKLIDFSLDAREWARYQNLSPRVINDPSWSALRPFLGSFKSFYEEAKRRDASMSARLLEEIKKRHARVAVAVTGGFHSAGMLERMKKEGVTVVEVVPRLTHADIATGSAYLSLFAQQTTPLERIFQGEKLFLSPLPFDVTKAIGGFLGDKAIKSDTEAKLVPQKNDFEREFGVAIAVNVDDPSRATVTIKEGSAASTVEVKTAGDLAINELPGPESIRPPDATGTNSSALPDFYTATSAQITAALLACGFTGNLETALLHVQAIRDRRPPQSDPVASMAGLGDEAREFLPVKQAHALAEQFSYPAPLEETIASVGESERRPRLVLPLEQELFILASSPMPESQRLALIREMVPLIVAGLRKRLEADPQNILAQDSSLDSESGAYKLDLHRYGISVDGMTLSSIRLHKSLQRMETVDVFVPSHRLAVRLMESDSIVAAIHALSTVLHGNEFEFDTASRHSKSEPKEFWRSWSDTVAHAAYRNFIWPMIAPLIAELAHRLKKSPVNILDFFGNPLFLSVVNDELNDLGISFDVRWHVINQWVTTEARKAVPPIVFHQLEIQHDSDLEKITGDRMDIVVAIGAFTHEVMEISSVETFLRLIRRGLNDDGMLILTGFGVTAVNAALLDACGFAVLNMTIPPAYLSEWPPTGDAAVDEFVRSDFNRQIYIARAAPESGAAINRPLENTSILLGLQHALPPIRESVSIDPAVFLSYAASSVHQFLVTTPTEALTKTMALREYLASVVPRDFPDAAQLLRLAIISLINNAHPEFMNELGTHWGDATLKSGFAWESDIDPESGADSNSFSIVRYLNQMGENSAGIAISKMLANSARGDLLQTFRNAMNDLRTILAANSRTPSEMIRRLYEERSFYSDNKPLRDLTVNDEKIKALLADIPALPDAIRRDLEADDYRELRSWFSMTEEQFKGVFLPYTASFRISTTESFSMQAQYRALSQLKKSVLEIIRDNNRPGGLKVIFGLNAEPESVEQVKYFSVLLVGGILTVFSLLLGPLATPPVQIGMGLLCLVPTSLAFLHHFAQGRFDPRLRYQFPSLAVAHLGIQVCLLGLLGVDPSYVFAAARWSPMVKTFSWFGFSVLIALWWFGVVFVPTHLRKFQGEAYRTGDWRRVTPYVRHLAAGSAVIAGVTILPVVGMGAIAWMGGMLIDFSMAGSAAWWAHVTIAIVGTPILFFSAVVGFVVGVNVHKQINPHDYWKTYDFASALALFCGRPNWDDLVSRQIVGRLRAVLQKRFKKSTQNAMETRKLLWDAIKGNPPFDKDPSFVRRLEPSAHAAGLTIGSDAEFSLAPAAGSFVQSDALRRIAAEMASRHDGAPVVQTLENLALVIDTLGQSTHFDPNHWTLSSEQYRRIRLWLQEITRLSRENFGEDSARALLESVLLPLPTRWTLPTAQKLLWRARRMKTWRGSMIVALRDAIPNDLDLARNNKETPLFTSPDNIRALRLEMARLALRARKENWISEEEFQERNQATVLWHWLHFLAREIPGFGDLPEITRWSGNVLMPFLPYPFQFSVDTILNAADVLRQTQLSENEPSLDSDSVVETLQKVLSVASSEKLMKEMGRMMRKIFKGMIADSDPHNPLGLNAELASVEQVKYFDTLLVGGGMVSVMAFLFGPVLSHWHLAVGAAVMGICVAAVAAVLALKNAPAKNKATFVAFLHLGSQLFVLGNLALLVPVLVPAFPECPHATQALSWFGLAAIVSAAWFVSVFLPKHMRSFREEADRQGWTGVARLWRQAVYVPYLAVGNIVLSGVTAAPVIAIATLLWMLDDSFNFPVVDAPSLVARLILVLYGTTISIAIGLDAREAAIKLHDYINGKFPLFRVLKLGGKTRSGGLFWIDPLKPLGFRRIAAGAYTPTSGPLSDNVVVHIAGPASETPRIASIDIGTQKPVIRWPSHSPRVFLRATTDGRHLVIVTPSFLYVVDWMAEATRWRISWAGSPPPAGTIGTVSSATGNDAHSIVDDLTEAFRKQDTVTVSFSDERNPDARLGLESSSGRWIWVRNVKKKFQITTTLRSSAAAPFFPLGPDRLRYLTYLNHEALELIAREARAMARVLDIGRDSRVLMLSGSARLALMAAELGAAVTFGADFLHYQSAAARVFDRNFGMISGLHDISTLKKMKSELWPPMTKIKRQIAKSGGTFKVEQVRPNPGETFSHIFALFLDEHDVLNLARIVEDIHPDKGAMIYLSFEKSAMKGWNRKGVEQALIAKIEEQGQGRVVDVLDTICLYSGHLLWESFFSEHSVAEDFFRALIIKVAPRRRDFHAEERVPVSTISEADDLDFVIGSPSLPLLHARATRVFQRSA